MWIKEIKVLFSSKEPNQMSFYYLLDYICFLYALLEQKQKFFFISEF